MILEIGTCDLNTEAGKVDGVFVEPVKYYFDRLPEGCLKENVAISNYEGSIDIFYVTDEEVEKYKFPKYIRGCSSVNNYHPTAVSLCKKMGVPLSVIRKDTVPVKRVKSIIDKYSITELLLLKLDTEGHDTIILNDFLDTVQILPTQIKFEYNSLSVRKDILAAMERLRLTGYACEVKGTDVYCRLR